MNNKLDKTKENIGAKNLDDRTKKDLFNKFVDGGGEVLSERKKRGFNDFDRNKQKSYRSKIDTHRTNVNSQAPGIKGISKKGAGTQKEGSGFMQRFLDRWQIKLKLYFSGVTDFSSVYLKPKFLRKLNLEYSTALMELQLIYLEVFKQKPPIARKIIDELDSTKLIYFDIIEKISEVYDRGLFVRISDDYSRPKRSSDQKQALMHIFKKLYVLNNYQQLLLFSFERAIKLQLKFEKGKAADYSQKRKKIRNNVYIIFNRLYSSLFWLFCYYEGRVFIPNEPMIAKILQITDDDRPGKRKKQTAPKDINGQETSDENQDKEDEKKEEIPKDVKKGLELMYKLNLKQLRADHDNKGILKHLPDTDKILNTYLLFKEFDKEYSFILTTNKIKYIAIYIASEKLDFRIRLSDLYNEEKTCFDSFHEYIELAELFERTTKQKPIDNASYMEYSKKLTSMEHEKKNIASKSRISVARFMDKVSDNLSQLIKDMEGPQKIVGNPQDELIFDPQIEGLHKLNKKKVYEAITEAYFYSMALAYRLGDFGDLSGAIEFKEGEKNISEGKQVSGEQEKASQKSASNEKSKPSEEDKEDPDKSIIEELDDLF